ncbi:MAG: hypothetical protein LBB42_02605 [Coriobacteriales bacterium]|jgi:hypothetical protein|nr:hypothetical protein [Coriobacteriales bacterium]
MNTKISFSKRSLVILLALVVACSGFLAAPATVFAASPETVGSKNGAAVATGEVLAAASVAATTITTTEPAMIEALAAKTYKVTLTIKMGKQGCSCPFLKLTKGSKNYYSQTVTKWYIDGSLAANPYSRFYSSGWKFSNHTVKVVMTVKVPKGTYKVYLDNGKKAKKIGTVKVVNKAVKKTLTFA